MHINADHLLRNQPAIVRFCGAGSWLAVLGDKLLGFLRDSVPADSNTRYNVLVHGLVEGGFAPTVSYAGRIAGDSTGGFYVGGALHYYVGVGYARTDGDAGFLTGDTIFGGGTPVRPDARIN